MTRTPMKNAGEISATTELMAGSSVLVEKDGIVRRADENELAEWLTATGQIPGAVEKVDFEAQYTGDGSTVTFALPSNPAGQKSNIDIFVNRTRIPSDEYTLSGLNVTLDETPTNGADVSIKVKVYTANGVSGDFPALSVNGARVTINTASRAAAVTHANAFGGGYPDGVLLSDGTVTYVKSAGATAISDMLDWLPFSIPALGHFNGSLVALQAYIESLASKDTAGADGDYTFSVPVNYDNKRSDTWAGRTEISNNNDIGSRLEYTGAGISVTATAATNANPAVFTKTAHGFINGEVVWARDTVGGTWEAALTGGPWTVGDVTSDTFTLANSLGAKLDGTSLGAFTSSVIRNLAKIAAFNLASSFGQAFTGLVLRTTQGTEAIVKIVGNDNLDSTDLSGSQTLFSGVQFIPKTNDITDANVVVENHKFAKFDLCWLAPGPADAEKGMRLGETRAASPRSLLRGTASQTVINQNFIFADVEARQVSGLIIDASQFDGTNDAVRLKTSSAAAASNIAIRATTFLNDGGADASGLPAVHQVYFDSGSNTLPYTGGWTLDANLFRDWPIGVQLDKGLARLSGNMFRGRNAGDVGIRIGARAHGEKIDGTNDFTQMLRAGNVGIEDKRYEKFTIISATQANPVVIGVTGHPFNENDRIRITGVIGMTELNDKEYIVKSPTANTLALHSVNDNGATSAAVDGTLFTAYTSGGQVWRPYMWHMDNSGAAKFVRGHGDMVFDLALDQLATLSSGDNSVLSLANCMIIGGHYEVSYGGVVRMNGVTGTTRFSVSVAGSKLADTYNSVECNDGTEEMSFSFQRRIHIPAQTTGVTIQFGANAPGAVQLRGKASGTFGLTYCQLRRV